jgi:hypothetical protein
MNAPGLLFPSARIKIDRASEQTDALEAEFEAFYTEQTYTIRQPFNPETGRKKAIFATTKPLNSRWAAVLGEIVHDLRSALDTAVYDLTIAEQGGPLKGTEFPIFEEEIMYMRATKSGDPARGSGLYKVRGVNERAKAVIRDAQPFEFRKTHSPDQAPILALLHELNIIDKHRTIHLMRQQTNAFGWRVLRDIQPISLAVISTLEDGAELGEWTPTVFDDEPDVEFNASFEVVFGETTTTLNGKGVILVCAPSLGAWTESSSTTSVGRWSPESLIKPVHRGCWGSGNHCG